MMVKIKELIKNLPIEVNIDDEFSLKSIVLETFSAIILLVYFLINVIIFC